MSASSVDVSSTPALPEVEPLPPEAYVRMATTLRVGLGLALVILAGGLVAYLLVNPGATSGNVLANNPILRYLNVPGLFSGLASGAVEAYLTLGLVALVATPLVRVLTGFYYFRRGRERAMTAITFAVLVMLLIGLLVIGPGVR